MNRKEKLKAYTEQHKRTLSCLTSKENILVFDIETDGLEGNTVHCIVGKSTGGTSLEGYGSYLESVAEDIKAYARAGGILAGHNIIGFDLPILERHYGTIGAKAVFDTKLMSKLLFPDIYLKTLENPVWRKNTPKKLWKSHSLKAWGYRLGIHKGLYGEKEGAWDNFSMEMLDYCTQDVEVNISLLRFLLSQMDEGDYKALALENEVAFILRKQRTFGVKFDSEAAKALSKRILVELKELKGYLQELFPSWQVLEKEYVAKVNRPKVGVKKGDLVRKYKTIEFNPNSSAHIVKVLSDHYGWEPIAFTDKGNPSVTSEVLADYANLKGVPEILKYMEAVKILGFLSSGKKAWLKLVDDKGLLHGFIDSLGTFTRRMSHNSPNLGQVPSNRKYLGKECRALFCPPDGFEVMLGIDADQLELRTLSHYLYPFDNGAYVKAATQGSKADGTDIHSINAKAMGTQRDPGKTSFYAYVYGAGDEKLGRTLTHGWDSELNLKHGKKTRKKLEKGVSGLKKLREALLSAYEKRGYLLDLDGMKFGIRSDHSVLNMINQRAGAILMKRALGIADWLLKEQGYTEWEDYAFMLNVHDEWQLAIRTKEKAEDIGKILEQSLLMAGEYYRLHLPITGSYSIGGNWSETH